LTPRRVLLTGGAGFIGLHLARRLADDDSTELTIVDDFSRGSVDEEFAAVADRPNVRVENADLTQPESWNALGGGYDDVYHLAAVLGVKHVLERPHDVLRVNALSTLHLLEWFTGGGGGKLLFSSTSEVYAWTQQVSVLPVPTPEDVPLSLTELENARSSYAGSKIFGELAVQQYCRRRDKPFVIVRFHNVYGPRMGHEHVIPELLGRVLAGQRPLVVYSPDHTRAFCYVSDAVDATFAAMREERANGRTLNIGNDLEELTIAELAARIITCADVDAGMEPRAAANDPVQRRCPDVSLARELLAYEPRTTLSEGLAQTVAWYTPRLAARGAAPTDPAG
jgi:UDP-glucose 4-epimerase/UDP-glucuronate decarboxylase